MEREFNIGDVVVFKEDVKRCINNKCIGELYEGRYKRIVKGVYESAEGVEYHTATEKGTNTRVFQPKDIIPFSDIGKYSFAVIEGLIKHVNSVVYASHE